jgi:hypothetical protein
MFGSEISSVEDIFGFESPVSTSRTEEEIEENTPILLNKNFSNYSPESPVTDFSLLTPDNSFECTNNHAVCFESSRNFTLTQIIVQGTEQENSLQEALLWVSSKPISIENMKKTFFMSGSNEKLFKNMKRTNEQEPLLFIKLEKSKFNFKFKPKYPTGKYIGLLFLEPEGHLEIDYIQFIGFESTTRKFLNIENVDEEKIQKSFQSNLEKFKHLLEIYLYKNVIMNAVKYDPLLFRKTSFELKHDLDVIFEAVKYSPIIVKYLSITEQGEPFIINEALKYHSSAIQYASKSLKEDKDFMMKLIQRNGNIFCEIVPYVPMLKKNPIFFLEALKFCPGILEDPNLPYKDLHPIGCSLYERKMKEEVAILIFEYGVKYENEFTPNAYCYLGKIYFNGTKKDFQKSKFYFDKAMELECYEGMDELQRLNNYLFSLDKNQLSVLENCTDEREYFFEKLLYSNEQRYIYKVKKKATNQFFAMKKIIIDIFDFNTILQEVVLLIQLKHEMICEIIDFFVEEDKENETYTLSIVMPLYSDDLFSIRKKQKFTENVNYSQIKFSAIEEDHY